MRKLAIIGRILLITFYSLVFLIGIAFAILLLCGKKLYCVETGSMEPNYPVGSMIVVERVWFESLKPGDVITYTVSENTVVTHRVVEIDSEHRLLTTKGDNNVVADTSPVRYENVLGRVEFCVPGFGYAFLFLNTRFGKIMLGIFAFGLVGFYIIKRMYYKALDEEEAENGEDGDSNEETEAAPEGVSCRVDSESDSGGIIPAKSEGSDGSAGNETAEISAAPVTGAEK